MRFSKEHPRAERRGKSFCVRALTDTHMERMGRRREFSERTEKRVVEEEKLR